MQQSDKRHWSLEPLQRRRITPNSAEMTRKCAYWTKHRETLHDPYTGNETNDQDFHQPYWKSSQIELCQTPTNKIQHDTTTVSCNKQISKIIFFLMKISSNTSQEYFNIQPRTKRHTRHKISKVNPQPRFRTPISSLKQQQVRLHLFLPQGPENHLQAQQYQPKIWNIHIDPVNHAYNSQRQFKLIWHPPRNKNPTTTIRQLPSNAYLRKSTRSPGISQHNTIEQHFPTLQHSTSTMLSYTISKMSQVLKFSSKHIKVPQRLTMCARRSQHTRRIPHRIFWPRITA